MRDTKISRLIRAELERLDPAFVGSETEDNYRAGVVLLAAVWVTGTDIDEVIQITAYDRDFVAAISQRMHRAGLWEEGGFVHSDHWFDENGYYSSVAFWVDLLVGLGKLLAKPDGNGSFWYQTAEQAWDTTTHLM
jgi:hypothetical protein